jgi:hypothetical protein
MNSTVMAVKISTVSTGVLFYQIGNGAFQFYRKGLRDLTAFKVFAQFHRLFQGAQAHLAGFARPDVCFDIPAGGGVEFPVDILGEPLEQCNTVFVGMVRVSPFHNTLSMLP